MNQNEKGLVVDAFSNMEFVREMLGQVMEAMQYFEAPDNPGLCKQIMATAGLEDAIQIIDSGVLNFLQEIVMKEPEGGAA